MNHYRIHQKLFASLLTKDANGRYWLTTPAEKGEITVEDAPFIIVALNVLKNVGGGRPRLELVDNIERKYIAGAKHSIFFKKNKGWKKANGEAIKNPELVKTCYTLYQEIKKHISITHVKGHANIEGNELADRMAVLARTSQEVGFLQYEKKINIREILATEPG